MTEPKRMIEEGGRGGLLVSSMQGEGLSAEAKLRLRASLGLGAVAAGAGAGVVATKLAAKGALGASSTNAVAGAMVAKWVGIAVLGVLTVGGAGIVATKTLFASSAPNTRAAASVPVATGTGATPAAGVPSFLSSPEVLPDAAPASPTPQATHPAPARRSPSRPARPAEPSADPAIDLPAEVRLLEVARRALRSGDSDAALAAIDRYRAAAPRGGLSVEADELEIEALVVSGRKDEAAANGRRFLARNGEGPLAERVRRLVGDTR